MSTLCFRCSNDLSLSGRPGRGDSCPSCKCDVHVCKNCCHFDLAAYNQCREPQAERVVDKERANFCDYFRARQGAFGKAGGTAKTLSDLEALFKKS